MNANQLNNDVVKLASYSESNMTIINRGLDSVKFVAQSQLAHGNLNNIDISEMNIVKQLDPSITPKYPHNLEPGSNDLQDSQELTPEQENILNADWDSILKDLNNHNKQQL